jgi:hypothetical protein
MREEVKEVYLIFQPGFFMPNVFVGVEDYRSCRQFAQRLADLGQGSPLTRTSQHVNASPLGREWIGIGRSRQNQGG